MKLIAIGLLACASWARAADPAPSTAPAAGLEGRAGAAEAEAAKCAPKEGIMLLKTVRKPATGRFGGCEPAIKTPPPPAPPVKFDLGGGSMLFDGLSGRNSLVKS